MGLFSTDVRVDYVRCRDHTDFISVTDLAPSFIFDQLVITTDVYLALTIS